jgi:mannose-6-phosphate isomerase-like protein (cupin superfamily)
VLAFVAPAHQAGYKGDTMKILAAITTSMLLAVPALAQHTITANDTTGVYMSASDVAAAVAKLPKNPLAAVPVFKLGPFNVNVEHRLGAPAAAQQASVHGNDAELFYMIDGTATLVTGGTLVDGTQNGTEWRGKGIQGGKEQKMSKGDFMMVPAGVPHWFTNIEGNITEFSLHLPGK